MNNFKCPRCKDTFSLPTCTKCGFTVLEYDGIWQFTSDPNLVIDGDSDQYIGYEHIGENYSGKRVYEDNDICGIAHLVKVAVEHVKDGVVLDLCCGDGVATVPFAKHGLRVIAADISNSMMWVAHKRASHNGISLDNVTFCRMNALNVDIADESIDVAICNSALHLISNPEKVVREIYRVLKKGGRYISIDDAPGNCSNIKYYDNNEYGRVVNTLYHSYWKYLDERGIYAKKLSWMFDKDGVFSSIFGEKSKEIQTVHRNKAHVNKFEDYELPRFKSRAFSDQTAVPEKFHEEAFDYAIGEVIKKCGEEYGNAEMRFTETDLQVVSYVK